MAQKQKYSDDDIYGLTTPSAKLSLGLKYKVGETEPLIFSAGGGSWEKFFSLNESQLSIVHPASLKFLRMMGVHDFFEHMQKYDAYFDMKLNFAPTDRNRSKLEIAIVNGSPDYFFDPSRGPLPDKSAYGGYKRYKDMQYYPDWWTLAASYATYARTKAWQISQDYGHYIDLEINSTNLLTSGGKIYHKDEFGKDTKNADWSVTPQLSTTIGHTFTQDVNDYINNLFSTKVMFSLTPDMVKKIGFTKDFLNPEVLLINEYQTPFYTNLKTLTKIWLGAQMINSLTDKFKFTQGSVRVGLDTNPGRLREGDFYRLNGTQFVEYAEGNVRSAYLEGKFMPDPTNPNRIITEMGVYVDIGLSKFGSLGINIRDIFTKENTYFYFGFTITGQLFGKYYPGG